MTVCGASIRAMATNDQITATLHGITVKATGTIDLPTGPVEFAFPASSGGPTDKVRNTPEHLLGGALASCWLLTFALVADKLRLKVVSTTMEVKVTVVREGPGLKIQRVEALPSIALRGDEAALSDKVRRAMELCARGCIVGKVLQSGVPEYVVTPSVTYVP